MAEAEVEVRVLAPGDEAQLLSFLEARIETSMILLNNVERAGLVDRGEPLQGTYAAAFDAGGELSAVASHVWNGNLVLEGDEGLERAALHAVSSSGRAVRGFLGKWSLVCRVRDALGMAATPSVHDGAELLYGLSLAELQLPELLSRSDVELRPPTSVEARELLYDWRVSYHVEILGSARSPALRQRAEREIEGWMSAGTIWVLLVAGRVVALTGFNAQARGVVQVGGVFTPPAERGQGYARAAVAASLKLAQARGARRSVLFTAQTNRAAQRAYSALGYQVIGDYGLVLF